MIVSFMDLLSEGGHKNTLGRAQEVVDIVLADQGRLGELFDCLYADDAWVRMRAIDSIEKIARVRPAWIEPYVDMLQREFAASTQASIQWHLAEIFTEVPLSDSQKAFALKWLEQLLSSTEVDWIATANAMTALAHFVRSGEYSKDKLLELLLLQQQHKSNAVKKRSSKLLLEFAI